MKNLQLKAMEFGANEILTRQQLKNTIGGHGLQSICYCKNDPFKKLIILHNDGRELRELLIARCGAGIEKYGCSSTIAARYD